MSVVQCVAFFIDSTSRQIYPSLKLTVPPRKLMLGRLYFLSCCDTRDFFRGAFAVTFREALFFDSQWVFVNIIPYASFSKPTPKQGGKTNETCHESWSIFFRWPAMTEAFVGSRSSLGLNETPNFWGWGEVGMAVFLSDRMGQGGVLHSWAIAGWSLGWFMCARSLNSTQQ